MKPFLLALLLVAAAIGIQAATDGRGRPVDSMIDASHDVGASAGRRGGGDMRTTSDSSRIAANRAGDQEEELGEADEDSLMPQADLAKPLPSNSLSVGEVLDVDASAPRKINRKALGTPAMLASCKKPWPFQIQTTGKTVHACVQCKPDAPLPYIIAKDGKRLIWACDANKFKQKDLCKKSLSWLDQVPNPRRGSRLSETGTNTITTCGKLKQLIRKNGKAAKLYSKRTHGLKLAENSKLTSELLYDKELLVLAITPKSARIQIGPRIQFGRTLVTVEKSVSVAYYNDKWSRVFTVLSHAVRTCGSILKHPVQCLDTKRSKCVSSLVKGSKEEFKSGQKLPGKVGKSRDRPCTPIQLLSLITSRKL